MFGGDGGARVPGSVLPLAADRDRSSSTSPGWRRHPGSPGFDPRKGLSLLPALGRDPPLRHPVRVRPQHRRHLHDRRQRSRSGRRPPDTGLFHRTLAVAQVPLLGYTAQTAPSPLGLQPPARRQGGPRETDGRLSAELRALSDEARGRVGGGCRARTGCGGLRRGGSADGEPTYPGSACGAFASSAGLRCRGERPGPSSSVVALRRGLRAACGETDRLAPGERVSAASIVVTTQRRSGSRIGWRRR